MTHAQGTPQGPARTRMRTRTWLEPLASCLRPSVLVDELGSEHVRLRVLGEQYLIQVLHWSHGVRSAEVRWAESHPAPGSLRSSRTDPSCEALLPTTGTVGTEGQHMVRSETGRGPAGLQESPTRSLGAGGVRAHHGAPGTGMHLPAGNQVLHCVYLSPGADME